jgi:hypothetical protein
MEVPASYGVALAARAKDFRTFLLHKRWLRPRSQRTEKRLAVVLHELRMKVGKKQFT